MEISEDTRLARDILQNIIKSKKTLRMYPQNNPVYVKALEDLYARFGDFFHFKGDLTFKINQHSIFHDSEEIYQNPEKDDNIALFFFKDGLRELTFRQGLLLEELESFMKIIAMDFDREAVDDDVVTLFWEGDFQNIYYVVDDTFLLDADGEEYEERAVTAAKQQVSDIDGLMKAYVEEFSEEDIKDVSVIPFSDKDLQNLMKELEHDSSNKIDKLTTILFEMFYHAEEMSAILEDTLKFFRETITFSLKEGNINTVIQIMKRAKEILEDPLSTEGMKKHIRMLLLYPGSDDALGTLGEVLDSNLIIQDEIFTLYIELLDRKAIMPLVKILGDIQTLRGRKKVMDALVFLGRQDIKTLASALNDQRWHVVRNIISILRKIRDKGSVEYLLKAMRTEDTRVKKEVIKALADLGGQEVIRPLKEHLSDPDAGVRIESARALGTIGSIASKKILLEKISDKMFKEKDIEEKKVFYEILSKWKDEEVFDFLIGTLKKGSFLWWDKNYEEKACAAFCLGLLGNKDALPYLQKYNDSKNQLLREFSQSAIRKLEYGQ
ncbi:MAG TPA: HEAT repeat domain-containing protein [Thermodesulfovibrionales bacterium]|nr:HEAT repeat domain-containing protein [Thermodesulfovibrionales bacterium]